MYQWPQSVPILHIGHTSTQHFFFIFAQILITPYFLLLSPTCYICLGVFMFVCIFDAFLYLVLVDLGLILQLQYVTTQAVLFVIG